MNIKNMLYTYGQIIQTYNQFKVDAREESIQNGDILIEFNTDSYVVNLVIYKDHSFYLYNQGKQAMVMTHMNRYSYYFKVTNYCDTYDKMCVELAKEWNSHYPTYNFYSHVYIDNVSDVMARKRKIYTVKNEVSNSRGMQQEDYMCRELKPGDFVYYLDNKNKRISYGLAISTTQVFTCDYSKKKIQNVLLIKNLTEDEKVAKADLAKHYNFQVRKYVVDNIKVGDLYRIGDTLCLYFGKCELKFIALGNTYNWVEYKHNLDNNYWVKMQGASTRIDIARLLEDRVYLEATLFRAFDESSVIEVKEYRASKTRVARYNSISAFNCLATEIPQTSSYLGHIDFKSKFILNSIYKDIIDRDINLSKYDIDVLLKG